MFQRCRIGLCYFSFKQVNNGIYSPDRNRVFFNTSKYKSVSSPYPNQARTFLYCNIINNLIKVLFWTCETGAGMQSFYHRVHVL